jgi:hypothetical protein
MFMIWNFRYGSLCGLGSGNFPHCFEVIVEKVCEWSKAMIENKEECKA